MRAASAGLSLTVHVALGAAIVWGSLDVRPPQPSRPAIFVVPPYRAMSPREAPAEPTAPIIQEGVHVPPIEFPTIVPTPPGGAPVWPDFDVRPWAGANFARGAGEEGPIDVARVEEPPAILAGPVPAYPELLRQAGIEGRVVLELVVDTAGRAEQGSVTVVSTSHPGFVAPAQRALAGTLFRPARMHGRPVRVRVRVPMDFILRAHGVTGG